MLTLITILVAAALFSLLLLAILVRSPLVKYFADEPDHRKVHQRAIPRLGGLGIVLVFLVMLIAAYFSRLWTPLPILPLMSMLFVGLFLLLAGTLDDVLSLGYRAKFLLQFLLAGVVVCVFHMQFESFSILGHLIPLGGMGVVVSMFWMVGVMNAFNIIDGIDGLAAGVSLCGFIGIGLLAFAVGAQNVLSVCAVLSGATLGFLYFNFHRRHKVFLGDTGAQFLGATLALLVLRIHAWPSVNHSVLIPILLIAYPALDTSVAMIRRFVKCRYDLNRRITSMFQADNDHLHHRLVYQGLSHLRSTFLLLILSSGFIAAAVLLTRVGWKGELAVIAYLILAVILILRRLGFIDVPVSRNLTSEVRYYEVLRAPEREMEEYSHELHGRKATNAINGNSRTQAQKETAP